MGSQVWHNRLKSILHMPISILFCWPFGGQFISSALATNNFTMLNSRTAIVCIAASTSRPCFRTWRLAATGSRWTRLTRLPRSCVPVVSVARHFGATFLLDQHPHWRTRSSVCTPINNSNYKLARHLGNCNKLNKHLSYAICHLPP